MKKQILLIIVITFFCSSIAYAYEFDFSLFSNSDDFIVEYDEMEGIGSIYHKKGCHILDRNYFTDDLADLEKSPINMYADIVFLDGYIPVFRFTLSYVGAEPLNMNKVILKSDNTRYTFNVASEVYDIGDVYKEYAILVITDENWQLINDMISNTGILQDRTGIDCRLVGTRQIDVVLNAVGQDTSRLITMRDMYLEALSGHTVEDFRAFRNSYPCTVTEVKGYQ